MLKDAVFQVASKFRYKSDALTIADSWRIMKEQNGTLTGDCDDFAITCFWYYSNKDLLKFLWNVMITHKYKLYRAKTAKGEYHIVGSVDDLWFDNWTQEPLSKNEFLYQTKHKILYIYPSPITAFYMLVGLFIK